MSEKNCQVCGVKIVDLSGHQKFCEKCAKKRQVEASHRYYMEHREAYSKRSKEQSLRRKQKRQEQHLMDESNPCRPPHYSLEQVNRKAIALGISYGRCSYLLSSGKISIE